MHKKLMESMTSSNTFTLRVLVDSKGLYLTKKGTFTKKLNEAKLYKTYDRAHGEALRLGLDTLPITCVLGGRHGVY